MKYAYITILAPLPEGEREIPPRWLQELPEGCYCHADILDVVEAESELRVADSCARKAMMRKIKRDGWPE